MDELAAAAAVVAMTIDDDAVEDVDLEDAPDTSAPADVLMVAVVATGAG